MRQLKPDRRKQFIYRGVLVTPEPVRGLLGRTWRIHDLGGSLIVGSTKEKARRVIDALVTEFSPYVRQVE